LSKVKSELNVVAGHISIVIFGGMTWALN